MGKKLQGASLRSKRRGKEAALEIVETQADHIEKQEVATKKDEELFVFDTTAKVEPAKKKSKTKATGETNQQKQNKHQENAQIERLMKSHTPEQLTQLAKPKQTTRKQSKKPTFDLWETEDTAVTTTNKSKKQQVVVAGIKSLHTSVVKAPAMQPKSKPHHTAIEVAAGGQSYRPDPKQHDQALNQAFQVEQSRHIAEIEQSKAPVRNGMSEETRALLIQDDSSDEESESEGEDMGTPTHRIVKNNKLTRAQRNKQKRLRAEEREIQERKRQKKQQNAVGEAKTISKLLRKEESQKEQRRALRQQQKLEKEKQPKGLNVYQKQSQANPVKAPTLPVTLKGEVSSGLRTICPKGSLLTDRMISLADRDMIAKKAVKVKKRVQGKRRKIKVKGKGYADSRDGGILG
eukprot:Nitzschia sp. Nitz4//scaffold179_size51476//19826//21037//NITZ4_006925-RA/size51476-processed-gene-0.49-mRNA-1//-1//CDS//3329539213//7434//frame0